MVIVSGTHTHTPLPPIKIYSKIWQEARVRIYRNNAHAMLAIWGAALDTHTYDNTPTHTDKDANISLIDPGRRYGK